MKEKRKMLKKKQINLYIRILYLVRKHGSDHTDSIEHKEFGALLWSGKHRK